MAYTYIPDEYGRPPHLRFDTPQDYVTYVRDLQAGKYPGVSADPQTIAQAEQIQRNPGGWEMSGGHPRQRPDWLARNLPWLGPAAVGAVIAGPAIAGLASGGGGGGSAAATGATSMATGNIPASTYLAASQAPSVAMTSPASLLAQGGGGSLWSRIWNGAQSVGDAVRGGGRALNNNREYAALAALLPLLLSMRDGGNAPDFGVKGLNEEISRSLAMQRGRLEQTQPVFDTLVSMAYGMSPTRYRGASPAGYPAGADAPPSGAYAYEGPRFGRG